MRTYDALPSFSLYIVDDSAIMGFFTHGFQGDYQPHLEVRLRLDSGPTKLATMIEQEYAALWRTAKAHAERSGHQE